MRSSLVALACACAAFLHTACGGCGDDGGAEADVADDTAVADTVDGIVLDTFVAPDTPKPADVDDVAEDTVPPDVGEDTLIADTAPEDTADTAEVFVPPPCPWDLYGEGLNGGRVAWVGYDGRAQPALYATTGPLLFRSADDGASWQRWAESVTPLQKLAFVPDDPKQILAISGSGLLESRDGGLTFASKALSGFGLTDVLVHPAAPRRVFAGTLAAGIFRSVDGGDAWSAANVGVPLSLTKALAGSSGDAGVVVAAIEMLNESLGAANVGALLRTTDGGAHWATVLDGITWGMDVTFCDATTAYAAVRRGLAKSEDAGATWTIVPGFGVMDVSDIAVSADCQRIYASVYAVGLFRSEDGGDTAVGPLLDGFAIEPQRFNADAIAIDPADSDHVFVANYGGLYETGDAGESWALTSVGQGIDATQLAASAESGTVWLGSWGSGVWRRGAQDDGWSRVPPSVLPRDFIFSIWADPVDEDEIFVGTIPDLWRSRDGGDHFEVMEIRGNVLGVARLDDGRVLAVTQTQGIQRLEEPEGAFVKVNAGLEPWPTAVGDVIDTRSIITLGEGLVLVGTNGRGIVRSTNGGDTWEATSGVGLTNAYVPRIVRSAVRDDAPIYALAATIGIYRSDDLGQTWVLGSTGFESLALNGLVADPGSDAIFVSTPNDGIYRSTDGATWSPFDRYCFPMPGAGPMAVVDDGVHRSLVAGGNASLSATHRLGPSTHE
ncbi:MAG: hypothetical protein H6745_26475 [Deltaproteobacteria bacterium]|nr:hypothetical protein [Deltaproteobacteria bacterium]